MPTPRHYTTLTFLLLLSLGLRLWHLDAKPLWLDEVLTALFTLGHSYQDVPLNVFFPLSQLDQIFTLQPGLSCADIANRITVESVHPPLFFCLLHSLLHGLLHSGLSWLRPDNWVWAIRLPPALFGVGAVGAIYWLNRVAFSPRAGLIAAALMAVSPFAVYLSQEARHYTLPMLLMTLALAALVQMQQDLLYAKHFRPAIWLGWSLLNLLGLYTHYFCLLALLAQIAALTGWMLWHSWPKPAQKPAQKQVQKPAQKIRPRYWAAWLLAIAVILIGYLPWLPTLLSHINRPETDWLIPYKPDWLDRLEPLYQTLVGWTLMVIALPVEAQPNWIAISTSVIMLGFMLWLIWCLLRQLKTKLRLQTHINPAAILLAGFVACVLLQFFAIVYLLDKDLTAVPRYNFIYYPGICALLAALLTPTKPPKSPLLECSPELYAEGLPSRTSTTFPSFYAFIPSPLLPLLLASLLSSLFVVNGLVFQKSYHPDRVARNMAFQPDRPLAMVMSYRSPQEVALGLSFALELQQLSETAPTAINNQVRVAFLDRTQGYNQAWKRLSELPQPLPPPLNLWVVASPGMRTKDYPQQLRLQAPATPTTRNRMRCQVDPDQLYRQGFPYQLFRCQPIEKPATVSSVSSSSQFLN